MTSPYVTPTIRTDAAAIIELLKAGKKTRIEIAAHFNRNKTALDRAFAFAKDSGHIALAQQGKNFWWCLTTEAYQIQAEVKRAAVEAETARSLNRNNMHYFDYDAVPDLPVVRRIIPAGSGKPPATNGARWVFEIAA